MVSGWVIGVASLPASPVCPTGRRCTFRLTGQHGPVNRSEGEAVSVSTREQQSGAVRVYHAGSLNAVLGQDIGPAFTAATGLRVESRGGASVDLANAIRSGEIEADIFMSADAEVNDEVLMGPANGDLVRWYAVMCRQRMVLAYSPASRFAADFEAAASGAKAWYEVLQAPG